MPLFWVFYLFMFCFLMGMLVFLFGGYSFFSSEDGSLSYKFSKSLWCW